MMLVRNLRKIVNSISIIRRLMSVIMRHHKKETPSIFRIVEVKDGF